jgi:predicted membrane channel-forming protein YqfA (hemolysin III family)
MFGMTTEAVKDVAERAVRTFVQVFLATYAPVVLGAGSLGGLLDLSVADKASTAGAVFSLVMGVLGVRAGSSEDNASVR